MVGEDVVDGADGHLGGAGDGADGFAVGVAGEDDAALVGVDDAGSAAGAAAGAGGGEPVAGLAADVAAAVLGQGEREVEDEAAFGVLAAMPSRTLTAMPRENRSLSTSRPSSRLRPSRSTSCTVSMSPERM